LETGQELKLNVMDINKIRNDFPILKQKVYSRPLVYLDSGATTQKPKIVIDALNDFYSLYNSNVHRGIHFLSDKATNSYENARNIVKNFINAGSPSEIIFTSGTTGSINLVAFSFGERFIQKGDEVLITAMEHHSNIVPWQMMCERKGAVLKVVPVDDNGDLIFEEFEKLINPKTKILSLTHVSNTLGTINPVKQIIATAHRNNIPVLLDGAQAIQHLKVDVKDLDCDFYAFSGHKIYGPTGIGVLYGKESLLKELPPYQGGGDMIESVTFEKTIYNRLPFKFEAGTANYVNAIGLGVAIEYLESIGFENIEKYENELKNYATERINKIERLKILGNPKEKIGIFSFNLENIHFYDAGMILDKLGIAVRTGTHCTQPLMERFGIDGTVRACFALYNTLEEVDVLCSGIEKVKEMFE
jgi:cysteine desulfurase / selenocysteine lyase